MDRLQTWLGEFCVVKRQRIIPGIRAEFSPGTGENELWKNDRAALLVSPALLLLRRMATEVGERQGTWSYNAMDMRPKENKVLRRAGINECLKLGFI